MAIGPCGGLPDMPVCSFRAFSVHMRELRQVGVIGSAQALRIASHPGGGQPSSATRPTVGDG